MPNTTHPTPVSAEPTHAPVASTTGTEPGTAAAHGGSSARPARVFEGLEGDRMAAWRAFMEAHARITGQLSRELQAEEGLQLTWYDVLVQLSEAPDRRLRMQELADRVLLSQSGLTRLVDRLQAEGYVERVRCTEDGRGTFAHLTPAGLAALRRTYPTHLRGVREWFADGLSDEEAVVLARALRRVADGLAGSGETVEDDCG
jgi:DNA-binding MarR family transcriptional regulator